MAVITLQRVAKAFGGVPVLAGFTLSAEGGERIGLVGANGAGKSTILRLIAGQEKVDGGTVHIARRLRLGYLPQEARFRSDRTLRESLLVVFAALHDQGARLRQLEAQLAESGSNPSAWDSDVLQTYTELLSLFEERGGYTYEQRVEQVLSGLGFARELWDQPSSTLSGGQKTRARLARLLLENPDFLLLDEPTNHLDLETTEWLETFLSGWQGGLIVVSHDRFFLDKVTKRTVEIVNGKAESYPAPYSRYTYLRAERYRRRQKEYQVQQAHITKTEEYIRRYGAGQRAKEARGRRTKLDRLERVEEAPKGRQAMGGLRLAAPERSGDTILSTVRLRIGYPGKGLLALPNVQVQRGQRIALIGPNGSGKSTFLRSLIGEIQPLGGSFAWGTNVAPGYYAQAHEDLRRDWTVLEEIQNTRPMSEEEARGYLGRFLFTGDDVFKKIGDVSGGERSRVALARLTLQKANVLLLDEPTNHLDIPARDALEEVLRDYNGSMIFVSHDRYFIDALATTLWVIEDGTIRVYDGRYSEYREAHSKGLLQQLPKVIEKAHSPRREPKKQSIPSITEDVWDGELLAHIVALRGLEHERGTLAMQLIDGHDKGSPPEELSPLAHEHAQRQKSLQEGDDILLAMIRRHLQ